MIESKELSLPALQKSYLRLRWLEQTLLMNSRYRRAMRGYYALRLTTVVGCLLILLLASLSMASAPGEWHAYARGLTIFFSLTVAACVTVEHLFDLGESHRRYERVAERLKAEGWRFLQLSGPYQSYGSHAEGFAAFANQVEALSQTDVEVYNYDVVGRRAAGTVAEARPREEEPPKKFFPLESVEPSGSPAVMHRAVGHHTSQPQAR
ncbi:MAG TPA: DUF4231 domain-containing protein [Pyrinomonadaceae bacterium]|nr:DUF4231 domain-containing protein [Pyrinomonadaceae bacterium]